jgi:hypothetical protein
MVPAGKWVNVGFEPLADPDPPAPPLPGIKARKRRRAAPSLPTGGREAGRAS